MTFPWKKKKHSRSKSASASASGLASSQETRQSQPDSPWSAYAPRLRQSPSPFPRDGHAFSTRATASGDLFLFGGYAGHGRSGSISNDLYSISTRDFSTTLLQTKGDAPNPRWAHCAVFIGATSTLFISGGATNLGDSDALHQSNDDSLYMLNLASPLSRDWIRIKVDGSRPVSRRRHTMTSDGSKLFIFGGRNGKTRLNDIWAIDLNCLESNPSWESYEPTAGTEKPLPRSGHVSIMTGDRIIIFGGSIGTHYLNDTWSFNISTRKWTELQCTGPIPSPRYSHAAVLVDDVMYVHGGLADDGTFLGDLTALNLSTQRWTSFQHIETGPCGRAAHAMASDRRRIFVFGGEISPGRGADEAKPIHVLDMKLLNLPEPDSNTVKHGENTIQLAQKLPPGQLYLKGSTEHRVKLVTPDAPLWKDLGESEDGRLVELERQLSEMLVEKNEQARRNAQLTDELALKSAQLERAEANAAKEKKRAGRELRKLQAKLDELLLSRGHPVEQALQKASHAAAEANERSQRELAEVYVKLEARESELAAVRLRLADTDNGYAKSKAKAASNCNDNESLPGLVNMDEDPGRAMHRLMERVQAMEAMATKGWNEKSFEMIECRNED